MLKMDEKTIKELSAAGSRGAFGKAIVDVGREFPETVVITADLMDSTKVRDFSLSFPERTFQAGVAEQNMVGIAAGLALGGKIPFATSFAAFASMRVCEQIRTDIAYPNLNVKIVGVDSGIIMGTTGITHYGREDMALLRCMPNITILSPADGQEIYKAVYAAVLHHGPVYLRLTGAKNLRIVHAEDIEFKIGKAIRIHEGQDVTLLATGTMVGEALAAADILAEKGVQCRVLDLHTIKPLDTEAVWSASKDVRLVVTIEEHTIIGGLGTAVAELLAEHGSAPPLERIGLPDDFGKVATYETLMSRYNLTAEGIADRTLKSKERERGLIER